MSISKNLYRFLETFFLYPFWDVLPKNPRKEVDKFSINFEYERTSNLTFRTSTGVPVVIFRQDPMYCMYSLTKES